jgi:hypothetical protein
LAPFGSRPHFINSQQFWFVFLVIMKNFYNYFKAPSG